MTHAISLTRLLRPAAALLAAAALVAACGGSSGGGSAASGGTTDGGAGGSGSSGGGTTVASTTVSGSVVKGPVGSSTVCAFKATATGKGEQLSCTTTNASGSYTLTLSYAGEVVVEASGGSYTDEATGATKTLADAMQVVVSTTAAGGTSTAMVTPLTAAAYSLALSTGGISAANYTAAANKVATQFQLSGVDLATTAPVVTGTANSYGMILKGVSQYVANGQTLASFIAWNSPNLLQTSFGAAYAAINGSTLTFTFDGGTVVVTPGDNSGGSSGGSGTESCGITVSGTGTVSQGGFTIPFNLPPTKVCVTGIPTGSCNAGNSTLASIAASGATPTGNYSINYNYSYAANDCAGALITVAYTPK